MRKKAYKKLKSLLGARCLEDKLGRLQYSYDATQRMYMPDVVVLPESTNEVSKIMKIAYEHNVPVVPKGWGSGFTGGSLNVEGGIAISLEKMDKIVEFDKDNLMIWVEAGLANYDLQEFLEPYGLIFPPDPSSWKFSTIGGNIAENAGGPRAVRYGVMKDWVKGLEVVLADGTIMQLGSKNIKDVAGYDLVDLIVGSEGTLAIVTKALLRLYPKPEHKKTIQMVFDDMKKAARTVSFIMRNKIIPTSMEFVDRDAIMAVEDALHIGLPTNADAILILEVDGNRAEVEENAETIEALCKNADGVIRFRIAKDEKEAEEIWVARRTISPTLKRIADGKINEDIVVPVSKLADMIDASQKIAKKYELKIVNFGHAGDGNIHVNIMYDTNDEQQTKSALKAMDDIFTACLSLGGSITGEHGVGITKKDYLEKQVGGDVMELYKRIKKAFDDRNILNPGKMGL